MTRTRARRKKTFAERLALWRREALARSGGAAMIMLGLWLTLALATFSISDPSLSTATPRAAENWMGASGAVIADLLLQALGGASLLAAPPLVIWGAAALARGAENLPEEKTPLDVAIRFIVGPIAFALIAGGLSLAPTPASWPFVVGLGGLVGEAVGAATTALVAFAKLPGASAIAALLLFSLGAAGYLFACGLTLRRLEAALAELDAFIGETRDFIAARFDAMSRADAAADNGDLDEDYEDYDASEDEFDEDAEPPLVATPRKRNIIRKTEGRKEGKREAREAQPELPVFKPGSYELPALSPAVRCIHGTHRQQLTAVHGMKRFRARIERSADKIGLDPIVFGVLLRLVQSPERHRIDPHPRSILAQAGGADGFAIFSGKRRIGFDRDQHSLPWHSLTFQSCGGMSRSPPIAANASATQCRWHWQGSAS